MTSLEVIALTGLPLIKAGDDLVELIASGLKLNEVEPRAQDVLVVAQKIVSKAEGRIVDLATVEPSALRRSRSRRMSTRTRGLWRLFSRSRFASCGLAAAC